MSSLLPTASLVREALREVEDPELGVNVVDLGLIYDVETDGADVRVVLTLTTPGCPLHATLREAVDRSVRLMVPGVGRVDVDLVWEPRWDPSRITDEGREALGWVW